MASLAKRADRGNRWQARYRDESGHEHARLFTKKADAEKWLATAKADIARGQWIDPAGAKREFKTYAEQWRKAQAHRDTTRAQVETHLRKHVYPTFEGRELGSIRRSEVQAWATGLSTTLAPSTTRVVYSFVASILRAAVDDRLISSSPCSRIALPDVAPKRVLPLPTEVVEAMVTTVPGRFGALILTQAGTGIRQGEVFGIEVDQIDFLRKTLTVRQQLVTMPKVAPYIAPPKTKAAVRVVPLPDVIVDALARHLAAFPPVPVEIQDRTGPREITRTVRLVFSDADCQPIRRTWFSASVWRPATRKVLKAHRAKLADAAAKARKAGLHPTPTTAPAAMTSHDLRHYYASLLIRHGESVKTVQARLGHANASETLDTYSHLWPDSDDRTREAVDVVLGSRDDSAAHPRVMPATP